VRLLFEPIDQHPCPCQGEVEIVHAEEQQEAVARRPAIGARQGGMVVRTPRVQAEQDRAIRVEELPEVVMRGRRVRLAE
jgi:hypothetical protein